MSASRADAAAALLIEARRSGVPLAGFPEACRPRDAEEAYAVQDAVLRRRGRAGAWKVGASAPAAAASFAPIGRLAESPAMLQSGSLRLFGIEAELAFRLGRDLPPIDRPYVRADIAAALAALHPVVEVLDSRFVDRLRVDEAARLADDLSNFALVVGPAVPDWPGRAVDLVAPALAVAIDGAAVAEGGGNAAGDPLRLVAELANHCAGRGGGLRRGDLVTTGSLSGLVLAHAGAAVVADFGPLGTVRVGFAP